MLYKIVHDNKSKLWCGPAAIAAVTGQPTSVITQMLRLVRGGKAVMGIHPHQLRSVMLQLGYRVQHRADPLGKITLARFAAENRELFATTPMIVELSTHYVVLMGRRFVDSWTKSPVFISSAPHRKARVVSAQTWVKVGEPSIPAAALPKPRDNRWSRARYLADKHGIEIERDGDMWWVTCEALEHDDPHEGANGCYDVGEVLTAVEDYVRCLTTGYLEAVTEPEHVAPALPPCPDKPADAVAYALEHHGPDTPIGIASTLSLLHGLDIRARQVRGAAVGLVRSGRARWFRHKLVLQQATA